jgi:uncharacterized membrane protein
MMTLFDYIYYRWFKLYAKEDSDPDIYASGIVSAYQLLTIINLVLLSSILFGFEYPKVTYLYPLIMVFFVFNYFRYERGFDISKLDDQWRNEPKEKKQRNWVLLIAYLVITFITPWIYGFATN